MRKPRQKNLTLKLIAALSSIQTTAKGEDIVVIPPSNSGFAVKDSTGSSTRFHVNESGATPNFSEFSGHIRPGIELGRDGEGHIDPAVQRKQVVFKVRLGGSLSLNRARPGFSKRM